MLRRERAKLIGIAVAGFLAVVLAYIIIYRLFFQSQDLAEERGNRIVAEDQAQAAADTASETIDTVQRGNAEKAEIQNRVRQGQSRVSQVDKGGTVDEEVDAAGAAALCGLHDSLCRD